MVANNCYGSATGNAAALTVLACPDPNYNRVSCTVSNNGQYVLGFVGDPNTSYTIWRSPTIAPAFWTNIATVPSDAQGLLYYVDPNPLSPKAFYRTLHP